MSYFTVAGSEPMLADSITEIAHAYIHQRGSKRLTYGPPENKNRADNAVATIWLVFYILALGVAIASPIVADTLMVAVR